MTEIPNPPDLRVVTMPLAAVMDAAYLLARISDMPEGSVLTHRIQTEAAKVARQITPAVLGHTARWSWQLVVEPIPPDPMGA
jgi:hypothetical protein